MYARKYTFFCAGLLALISFAGSFLLFPRSVSAVTEMAVCVTEAVAGKAEAAPGAALAVANKALSVSVSNPALEAFETSQTAAQATQANLDFKNCIMKPMMRIIAKTILHNMTQSVVKWINSGFRGSPSFVTNPEGFLAGVADQSFGRMIEDIAPVLCQPFRFQLQLGLGFQFSSKFQDEVRCKLSDVITNIQGFYDSFVGGQFSAGGWESWINIAGVPQNNAYGAYLAAQGQIRAGIVDAQGRELNLLNWGKGFQSWRVCKRYEEIPENFVELNPKMKKGKCLEYGPIKTPGAVIVDQTSGALQSELRQLEVAQEIDEIFGALVSQLLTRAFGGSSGGLSGLSQPDSSGITYINSIRLLPGDEFKNITAEKPHVDIDCSRNYVAGGTDTVGGAKEATPLLSGLSVPAKKLIYPPSKPNRENDILLVEALDETSSFPTGLNEVALESEETAKKYTVEDKALGFSETIRKPILKPTTVPLTRWDTYMRAIGIACSREATDKLIGRGEDTVGSNVTRQGTGGAGAVITPVSPGPTVETREGNIAQGKKARQSSTLQTTGDTGPENAVNTSKVGTWNGGFYGLALTQARAGVEEWWGVDLETEESGDKHDWVVDKIEKINIYGASGSVHCSYTLYRNSFRVFITNIDPFFLSNAALDAKNAPDVVYKGTHKISETAGNTVVEITSPALPAGTKGRYIKIAQTVPVAGCDWGRAGEGGLGIAEVEVIGKATRTTKTASEPAAAKPFQIVAVPAESPGGRIQMPGTFGPLDPRPDEFLDRAAGTTTAFVAVNKGGKIKRLELRLCKGNEFQVDTSKPCGKDFSQVPIENFFALFSAAILNAGVPSGTKTGLETDTNTLSPIQLYTGDITINEGSDNRVSVNFSGRLKDSGFAPPNNYKFIIQALYDIPKAVGVGTDEKTTTSVINFTVRP